MTADWVLHIQQLQGHAGIAAFQFLCCKPAEELVVVSASCPLSALSLRLGRHAHQLSSLGPGVQPGAQAFFCSQEQYFLKGKVAPWATHIHCSVRSYTD